MGEGLSGSARPGWNSPVDAPRDKPHVEEPLVIRWSLAPVFLLASLAWADPHVETGGLVVVEAEHYADKSPDVTGNRAWYIQSGGSSGPGPDPDPFHTGAAGNAYVECLPDTRVTHDDPFAPGSFYGEATGGARLDYPIYFHTPGQYRVWVRAQSTGTEDNGLHVGVDGGTTASGMRIQWCGGGWLWSNAQRDSGGTACGVNGTITINIPAPGLHVITFHQREDGAELDRFLLTTNAAYTPSGVGPAESPRQAAQTVVGISGENFLINGQLTYSDIAGAPTAMHGLLFNVRGVNATFDDLALGAGGLPAGFLDDPGNHPDNNFAGYGSWNPSANTDRFVAALPSWRAKGVLAVTLNFQGGCSCTRHNPGAGIILAGDNQTPNNNPFGSNGTPINTAYLDRLGRCIEALDQNGMVCILGLFYFGQDQRISNANDSQAIKNAVDAVVDWVLANDWRNVLIEINNETTVGGYQHAILAPSRVHELFQRVKTRSVRPDGTRLFVSASSTGTALPPDNWMLGADFFLPHGNGLNSTQISQLVAAYRANSRWQANPRPICFNEDSVSIPNLNAAAAAHTSWGLYDDRHHQSVWPANWTIWHPDDIAFFDRVAELVGLVGGGGNDKRWIPAATWPQKTFQGAMTVSSQYTSASSSPPDADPDEDALVGQLVFANTNVSNGPDAIIYTVDLPASGNWYAWGRVYYPGTIDSNDPNSFWISVDGGPEFSFGNNRYGDPSFREWHWDGSGTAESGVQPLSLGHLQAGVRQVKVRNREADPVIGPRLDMLLLTNSGAYVPTDSDAVAGLAPVIRLEPAQIARTTVFGKGLSNDMFTIANRGVGTLNYTVSDDADWLSVAPVSGSVETETDSIDLIYDLVGRPPGQLTATVTVSSLAAGNSPQTVSVTVDIQTLPPDFDGDLDVDLDDFGHLQYCFSGPGITQNDPVCQDARLDVDLDVDQDDFRILLACLEGANIVPDPACLGSWGQ